MIYGKNRVNNEIDNIDCDIVEDAKIYATKYINIVNDKQVLINALSESIDELMEGLDVDTSNDIAVEKLKDFKSSLIKFVNKFKQDTKTKDIEKKISKRKISKRKILKIASNMMLKMMISQILN